MFNVIGDFFGSSGYANHTRNLANALFKQTKTRISTNLPLGWEQNVNDNELLMIKTKPEKDEINLIITMPHQWKLFTGPGRNIAYCVWEGNKVPKSFIEEFLNPDIEYIFVPSMHTKEALCQTIRESATTDDYISGILHNKIKIIPHGVDLTKFYSQRKKDGDDGSNVPHLETRSRVEEENTTEKMTTSSVEHVDNHADIFTFVANKGFRNLEDRGGIQYLIQAYLEEFTNQDKVELLIKINPAYGIGPIQELIKKYAKPNNPIIKINTENMPYEKLVNLYNKGNVFVSPTRADAFNLPGLESHACGLPTIQTNYGGQLDYMKEDIDFFVDYELREVEHECMYEGISWAKIKIEDLRKKMRYAYENQEEIKQRGQKAIEDSKNWTWDNSATKIVTLK